MHTNTKSDWGCILGRDPYSIHVSWKFVVFLCIPVDQPTKQPTPQPTNQPTNQPTIPPIHQPTNQPTSQTNQNTFKQINTPNNQPTNENEWKHNLCSGDVKKKKSS